MADGRKDEAGFALIYALTAIILSTLMIGLVFMIARNVNSQIRTIDTFRRVEDVHEYSFQLASQQLKTRMDRFITNTMSAGGFSSYAGDWQNRFESEIADALNTVRVNDDLEAKYEVSLRIVDFKIEEIAPYLMVNSGGEQGWTQSNSYLPDVTNLKVTVQLGSEVIDQTQIREGQPFLHTADAEYVYEVQFEEADFEQVLTQLDIWRNIFYPYYLPSTAGQGVSADTWIRKLYEIYEFQNIKQAFDYLNYQSTEFASFGYSDHILKDFRDGRFLDFRGKPILDQLHFDGSFTFNNGVQMEGQQSGYFSTKSLLTILNDGGEQPRNGLNLIKDVNLQAGLGLFIDLSSQTGSRLVLSHENTEIVTGNLWINNTNSTATAFDSEGILLAEGDLKLYSNDPDPIHNLGPINVNYFSLYLREAAKLNPAADASLSQMNASMVLTSSNFYAGPVTEGSILHSTEDTHRRIDVSGNFMMSNATIPNGGGINNFSYFQNQNQFTVPHTPSRVTLDGSNTSMTVQGLSFIDSPKTARRRALAESGTSAIFQDFYDDPMYWNRITLRNGAQMDLGYTGVEPFILEVDRDSEFSMKLLPDLEYFDFSFLASGYHSHRLEGKVILEPLYISDQLELENQLIQLGISYSVHNTKQDAQPGEVTILRSYFDKSTGFDPDDKQLAITRIFEYINTINY